MDADKSSVRGLVNPNCTGLIWSCLLAARAQVYQIIYIFDDNLALLSVYLLHHYNYNMRAPTRTGDEDLRDDGLQMEIRGPS